MGLFGRFGKKPGPEPRPEPKPEPKSSVPEGKFRPLLTEISKELEKAGYLTSDVRSFAVGKDGKPVEGQPYPGCIGIIAKKPELRMFGKLWVSGGPEGEEPADPDEKWRLYTPFVAEIDNLKEIFHALQKVRKVLVEVVET